MEHAGSGSSLRSQNPLFIYWFKYVSTRLLQNNLYFLAKKNESQFELIQLRALWYNHCLESFLHNWAPAARAVPWHFPGEQGTRLSLWLSTTTRFFAGASSPFVV